MAILQISKIQQRSGNLVDLPQLDDAEFGWANDAKRLFIGKTTPNENVEVLTSYSRISFGQLDGAIGNLNINPVDIANGQVLAFDGTDWVNKGGDAGGLITLGDVSNVKLTGGAIGYVLQTDGTGNLSWTPKGTLVSEILNVSSSTTAVVTTVSENFFNNGAQVTILNPQGMTQLAGNIYYANVLTTTTFRLYSSFDGANFSGNVNTTGYTDYSYSTVSGTTVSTNVITVADATVFSVGQAVKFIGDMSTSGIENNVTYYVANAVSTSLKVATSSEGNIQANIVPLQTTTGLTAEVYAIDGQAVATTSSGVTFSPAGGTNTTVQFNQGGSLQGSSALVFDYGANVLTLNGNANVGNLNATTSVTTGVLVSNTSTGNAPLIVNSTTQVGNLYATRSNVSDQSTVTNQTTGTFYPVFASSSATGNRALGANANISFNVATGNLSVTLLNVTSNANVGNLGTAQVLATANITAPQLISNIATGTAPLVVTSTTQVANLNSETAGTVRTNAQPNITSVGTLTSLSVTGNVSAGNVSGTLLTGTLTTAAQPNITSVGTLTSLGVNGTVTAVAFTANTGVFTGNGSGLSAIAGANVTGTVATATTAGTVTTAAQPNITSVGTLTSLAVTGNISGANLTGNHYGNGSALSSITGANVTGTVANATFATNAGTVTTAAQPNITSVGTLTGLTVSGNASFTGANISLGSNANVRITGGTNGQILGTDGSGNLSWLNQSSIVGAAAGSNTQIQFNNQGILGASANFTFNSLTNVLTVGGNIVSNSTIGGATASHLGTTLTTGANTTAGTITGNWSLSAGSRLNATYADLAEYYEADESYEPGTVLMFGGDKEVTIAEDGTNRVAGVVSTNPAYLMNNDCPGNKVAIALQGRVPVKVRGKISKGDMMVSGGNGFARPNQFPTIGSVIGKALENFDGYEGVIEVAIGRL